MLDPCFCHSGLKWTYEILRDNLSELNTFDLALGLLSQLPIISLTRRCETNIGVVKLSHRVEPTERSVL